MSESPSGLKQSIQEIQISRAQHTGTSMTLTIALVLRSPNSQSHINKLKNRTTKRATEAGKETLLSPIRELTPKHARSIINVPTGTKSHAVELRRHDSRATWNFVSFLNSSFCQTSTIPGAMPRDHQTKALGTLDSQTSSRNIEFVRREESCDSKNIDLRP